MDYICLVTGFLLWFTLSALQFFGCPCGSNHNQLNANTILRQMLAVAQFSVSVCSICVRLIPIVLTSKQCLKNWWTLKNRLPPISLVLKKIN
jgi:hypothetical protein